MRKALGPTVIKASCAETGCRWPGVDEVSLDVARKEAKDHLWHTGHRCLVTTTEFVEEGEAV